MALSKQIARELYRPNGPKVITLGTSTPSLATGGQLAFNQQVDLSLPIRGIQLIFKGRVVVVGALASVNPEGFPAFLNNVTIQGVNARQQGNLTLWSASLADIIVMSHLTSPNRGMATYSINSGTGLTVEPPPSTPFPPSWNPTGTAGTYDFIIVTNIPFAPFALNGFGKSPFATPLFAVRNEEWKDSLQILLQFIGQGNGAVAGALGMGVAGSTFTFSAFGSATGSPTVDLYSLPMLSGLTAKDSYLPGVVSRVTYPISNILQNAGNQVTIANLQKQPSPRLYAKFGTTNPGSVAFATLSDTNVTSIGIQLGGNRSIRNLVDVNAHKNVVTDEYGSNPVQGWNLLDFIQNGNYDSSFPGQDIGDGASFQLQANVTGVANAQGNIIQEQMLHTPTGPLAS